MSLTKPVFVSLAFDWVEQYAPGFKKSVVGRDILTPPDLERIFGLTGGVCTQTHPFLYEKQKSATYKWNTILVQTLVQALWVVFSGTVEWSSNLNIDRDLVCLTQSTFQWLRKSFASSAAFWHSLIRFSTDLLPKQLMVTGGFITTQGSESKFTPVV